MIAPALQMTGVVKRYGRIRALDGLDLTVPQGSIFGLVGSNGAGKTTAMAVAAGLLEPADGEVAVLGDGPFRAERHAGRIALLPQDSRFPPHARVDALLRFYGELQGLRGRELRQSMDGLLEWVHLQDRRQSAVRTLSHGMNRRLAIAQAFLGSPALVLLDEPLNGLDPREAARMREMIRERRGRQTIVISSHNLADIEALCDTVAFIERGRRLRQDTVDTITGRRHSLIYVLARPAAPLAALAAAMPEVAWELSPDGTELSVTFTEAATPESVNAQALPLLIREGVGILEVKRGSDLETEYLRIHPSAASDRPPPLSGDSIEPTIQE